LHSFPYWEEMAGPADYASCTSPNFYLVPLLTKKLFICNAFMKKLLNKYLSPKFIRFIVVGLISAAIEYSLYFLLKTILNYQVANVLSFALTNIVTFLLSRRYVFVSNNENKTEELTLFVLCLFGALFVSQVVLWSLVEYVNVDDMIAKGFAISVAVIWNFFTRKHIVFKQREVVVPDDAIPVPDAIEENEE
jgi:putative flippase GtrA